MKTLQDQIGIVHTFEITPKRIISIVPSITELLCDLGLEPNNVGITKFCVHPYHLKSTKESIGGTKKVNYEKIRALHPDIIIANKEENTMEMVTELKTICTVWVTDIIKIEHNSKMITDFGQIFNCRTEAAKLNDKLNFALANFQEVMKGKPFLKAAYFIWKNPYMVSGGDNYINEILKLNHFTNIFENRGRYPEIEIEKLQQEGDPEILFLSSEPYPFKEEDAFEIGRFTHHAKVIFVDGEMFSWYGSRLLKAFNYMSILQKQLETS